MNISKAIYNHEVEKSILSSFFVEPGLINITKLKGVHFFDSIHKKLMDRMIELKLKRIEIDVASMSDDFDLELLYDYCSYVFTTNLFEQRENIIIEDYNRRVIETRAKQLSTIVASSSYIELLDYMNETLGLLQGKEQNKTLIAGSFDTLENLKKNKNYSLICPTGFPQLDDYLGGYRPGAFYILGGRPGQGKSLVMLNLCLEAMIQDVRTCIFSLEMLDNEIHERFMGYVSGKNKRQIESGDHKIIDEVADKIVSSGIHTDCNIYDDVKYIEDIERIIAREAGLGTKIVYIDYMQLIQSKKRTSNTNDKVGYISSTLKSLAQKYRISIFCLSQLNRSLGEGEMPGLKNLRDSGNLEQDIDVCIMIQGYDDYDKTLSLGIVKNRQGENGSMHVKVKKDIFKMYK